MGSFDPRLFVCLLFFFSGLLAKSPVLERFWNIFQLKCPPNVLEKSSEHEFCHSGDEAGKRTFPFSSLYVHTKKLAETPVVFMSCCGSLTRGDAALYLNQSLISCFS